MRAASSTNAVQTVEHYRRLFSYDEWANREVLTGFGSVGNPPPRSLKLLGHILGTEYEWFSRICGSKSPLAVWPPLTVEACQQYAAELSNVWSAHLNGMDETGLARNITYQNSKGESWNNSVKDILMHVIMHSAYHRGQIASDMRAHGHSPAYTDFIHGVRQKLVK
jgi:uncharacterized damage-inducible protein DinB